MSAFNQPLMIDTHCHLDLTHYDNDIESVLQNAYNAGVKQIIIPAADIATLPKAQEIAKKYETVFFAVGTHPCDIDTFDMAVLREFINDKKCVAVGECGLDYFHLPQDSSDAQINEIKHKQKEVFIAQIELAIEFNKPLIVHIRESSQDAFDILDSYKDVRGVLHCYNANKVLLGLSERFFYGIGGICTFKNAQALLEVLPLLPKHRILLETDAPYLAPHPHRGTRNEPKYIPLIAQKIAGILGISFAEVCAQSTQNAYNLFSQIPPLQSLHNDCKGVDSIDIYHLQKEKAV